VLGQPAAGRQVLGREADGDVVADDLALGQIAQRHLVALRDRFQQRQAVGEDCAGRQAAVVDDNRDVIVVVHEDVARRAGARRGGHLAFLRCFLSRKVVRPLQLLAAQLCIVACAPQSETRMFSGV
jgi:hypothetical protein